MVAAKKQPAIRDMVNLSIPYEVRISPDGKNIAYLVRQTDWNDNAYQRHCFVYNRETKHTRQLSRRGTVSQIEWVGNTSLAVLKRENKSSQIFLFQDLTGEPMRVTKHKGGVHRFLPFGEGFLYKANDPEKRENEDRKKQFGDFQYFEQEESASALYYVSLPRLKEYLTAMRLAGENDEDNLQRPEVMLSKLMETPYSITSFAAAPNDKTIYLNCRVRDDLVYAKDTAVFALQVDAERALQKHLDKEKAEADKEEKDEEKDTTKEENEKPDYAYLGKVRQIQVPKGVRVVDVSPDSEQVLLSYPERDDKFYTREDYFVADRKRLFAARTPAGGLSKMKNISAALDRIPLSGKWTETGIYASFVDSTQMKIVRLSTEAAPTVLDFGELALNMDFDIADTGEIVMVAANGNRFFEVCLTKNAAKRKKLQTEPITEFGKQIEDWDLGTVETIRWKSKDGTEIEGVLRKPTNFNPKKKYPLVFIVHGGPSWFSGEYLLSGILMNYYPGIQFINQDMLVIEPNYRGSLGRGQAFLELNKDNLGVGDLWDVESAIDYLDAQGIVDLKKVGCMGWSQGGYISAFAGLHSQRFTAVSVGAGVSDWYTYHISNDVPTFTTDYLSGNPWQDRAIYEKTSPMANIENASTPMLIQHGENDQRVPLSNAMELYRGLQAMEVPVELFVYPGMGHPITRPRENHAVLYQNLNWFGHYLLGQELDLLNSKQTED